MNNMRCLTPIPLVMNQLLTDIQVIYPDCSFKFDPTLSYEESIKGLRAIRSSMAIKKEQVFPLFTYQFGPLKLFQQGRRNFPIQRPADPQADPHANDFIGKLCEMEITWKFYYSDIINFTTFQIFYMAEKSFNDVKQIKVTLPEIGDFNYFITWDLGIDQVDYSKQDNFYAAASGKAVLKGEFLIGIDPTLALITEINSRLRDQNTSKVLDWLQITPEGSEYKEV